MSVFDADTKRCLLTRALEVAQKFIFFHSYVRGKKVHSPEYEQANLAASIDWKEQKDYFCSQAQTGSVIEL